jgi:hypothetical protein
MSDRHQIHCITFHLRDLLLKIRQAANEMEADREAALQEIERLRAVLQRIADMPVDGYESTIPVRAIARVALEGDNENDDTDGTGVNTDWLRDDAGR